MKYLFRLLLILFMPLMSLQANEADTSSTLTMDYFYLDTENSESEFVRLCVPVAFPEWFSVPLTAVEKIEKLGEETVQGNVYDKMHVVFKNEQMNSILSAYNMASNELNINRWAPPWNWSKCAKCRLSVHAFITTSILVTIVAAGVSGPGALAIWQAMIIGKYGLAAWEAVKSIIFSEGVDSISRKICEATGKC